MWVFYHNVTSSTPPGVYSDPGTFNFAIGVAAMFIVGFLPMMIVHMAGKKDETH